MVLHNVTVNPVGTVKIIVGPDMVTDDELRVLQNLSHGFVNISGNWHIRFSDMDRFSLALKTANLWMKS